MSSTSIYIQTLGCAKNEVDSRHMAENLLDAGFSVVDTPFDADVLIVNSCGFLEAATRESIEVALELAEDKNDKLLIMTGCVPARYGEELQKELREVDVFVTVEQESSIARIVSELMKNKQAMQPLPTEQSSQAVPEEKESAEQIAQRIAQQKQEPSQKQESQAEWDTLAVQEELDEWDVPHVTPQNTLKQGWAYVKISDGCDRFCSFCTIPYIRGRYASRPYQDIEKEVRSLLEAGVKEVVFVGQDTGVYGQDFKKKKIATQPHSLAQLVLRLQPLFAKAHARMRLLYIQPDGMDEELLNAFATCDELINYIDIPIQHTSQTLLARMKRKGSIDTFRALFQTIKERLGTVTLRTTAMVGFPGETQKEVDELLGFIDEVDFDYVSCFAYSQEAPARAASFEDQIDEEMKLERLQMLLDTTQAAGEKQIARHVGETVTVLVTGEEDGKSIGRAWFQAPDSDGIVIIDDKHIEPGTLVSVKLVDSVGFDCIGETER